MSVITPIGLNAITYTERLFLTGALRVLEIGLLGLVIRALHWRAVILHVGRGHLYNGI